MKATIVNVNIENRKAIVNYNTGTVREYPEDKLPKTVQEYLDIQVEVDAMNAYIQEQEEKETATENTIETVQHEITVIPQLPAVVAREEKETVQEQEVRIAPYRMIPVLLLIIAASLTRQLASICYIIADITEWAGQRRKEIKDIYMIYRYPVYEYIQYIRMQAQDAWVWREEIIRENRGAKE